MIANPKLMDIVGNQAQEIGSGRGGRAAVARAIWIAVGLATLGACGGGAGIAPTPSPLAIGDPCLVGRWTSTSLQEPDSSSFPGVTMVITGGEGTVIIFSADGKEVDDFTNAAPFTAVGGGHHYTMIYRGVAHFTIVARDHMWTESGPPQQITASHVVVDGAPQSDYSAQALPASGTYTCSGSSATFVTVAPGPNTETFKK